MHLLHRLQEGELSAVKPTVVVLNIGTNDLHTYWDRETIKVGHVVECRELLKNAQ